MFESGNRERSRQRLVKKQEVNDRDAWSQRHRRSIPKESGEMAAEEQSLETCPRNEGPENDSEETLKDIEKRLANNAEGRAVWVCVDERLCCD